MPDDARHPAIDKFAPAEPARHNRPGTRAASRVSLLDGAQRRADRPAAGRRGNDLERGGAVQHRPVAPGAGRQEGRRGGGRTPREFTTITVTDGIAMGHEGMKSSLVSREVIADSVELTMRGIATTRWWASRAATSRCPG